MGISSEAEPQRAATGRNARRESATRQDTVWSSTTPLRHMPQLDAIRAVAVGMVLFYHFWRPGRQYVAFGPIGVRVFFVLSGFLITGILLRSRALRDSGRTPASVALRRFYVRRVLRIFPLYYLALAVAWYGSVWGAREGMAWHVAYLSNVHFFLVNAVSPGKWGGHVAHLWSLSVEEQFYLVWPWIILFVPRRWLPGVALGAAAIGPLFRYLIFSMTGNDVTPILPLGCIDSLALGAYLATTIAPEYQLHPLKRRIGASVLWSGVLLFAAYQAAVLADRYWTFRMVSFDLAIALMSLWLVARAAAGMGGVAGRILDNRALRYIGVISYGIYIWHLMLPDLLPQIASRLGYPGALERLGDQTLSYLLFYSAASTAVAAVSWHCFEGPINRQKDRFDYR